MRTTVDIDDQILEAARRRAADRKATLGEVVSDALRSYLLVDSEPTAEPFELLVAGSPGGRYPSPAEVANLLDGQDRARDSGR